ncbi:MAG: hypothetical protein IJV94_03515 [Bacilli bacterium]|nr:hypothetical protein [Bacilli bacterium]
MKRIQKIEDYQLKELQLERLYINKYDLSLIYSYELNRYWKEFFFDIIVELSKKEGSTIHISSNNVFNDLKKDYKHIIKIFNLNIDFKDYIELNDYLSLHEWLKDNPNNDIIYQDCIYLYTDN